MPQDGAIPSDLSPKASSTLPSETEEEPDIESILAELDIISAEILKQATKKRPDTSSEEDPTGDHSG